MSEERYEDSHLYRIRHSAAHIMAQAVLEAYPEAKIAIGPPIEDGFYYDFELPESINDDDLKQIEKRMRKIASGVHEFNVREVTPVEAREIFADQPYKLELIDDLVNGRVDENGEQIAEPAEKLTIYTQDTFTDLCRGPHVASTKEINPKALSITFRPPAGAYWRGNEKNKMLTRIYGTAWETPEELNGFIERLEEAKRRDHRVLGDKLDLFAIDPLVGKGLPLWLPKGAVLRDTLERWLRQVQIDNGYLPVVTPHIGNLNLYKTSGHYPYYSDSQYTPIDVDEEQFLLKPMNCPHHCMIYKHRPRSYRDLPLRLAEFGTVYRYEQSGELNGLTRVRGFTVDDAHLFVRPEQLLGEFKDVVRLIQYVFNTLGLSDFKARVGTRDPESDKYVGDPAAWEKATAAIIEACDDLGLSYVVESGEAAFYGPKLDFIVRDVLKREWQLGTVQVDYNLPERFELEYVDQDNERKRPVMIHRAPFGSIERFVGILIEHFAGAFPVWLAPVQAVVIPIREHHNAYAEEVEAQLKAQGIRVEADLRDRNMRNKIKEHRQFLVPYLLVVGDRDMEERTVSVRLRTDEDLGAIPLDQFMQMIRELAQSNSMELTLAPQAGD
ncbi:MAG: threonine--tRNA ligase [Anaerolineae bacterium]|nr:threonine--tRNA ligase [Anaerolineae bacterium]MCA9892182.1 threonine--tRNA ligase [Anaerolineae bacterium]